MRVTLLRMLVVAAVLGPASLAAVQAEPSAKAVSGLPIPRFVSLKTNQVNVRAGPTKDHGVAWVYNRSGLPVEITAEFETWRRIRDWEGAEGWVYHSLLSGRRTVTIAPSEKNKDELLALRDSPTADSAVVAKLQVGVQASVKRCNGTWCRITGERFDGWIQQVRLWGVYPDEKVD